MAISALGYVCIGASDLDRWEVFGRDVLGLQVRRSGDGALLMRADSRDWRFRIEQSDQDDIVAVGWECAGEAEYRALLAQLGDLACESPELAAQRGVCGLARFVDPSGTHCELFWGASERTDQPFASTHGVSGFVTGEQGLGHVVLVTPDPAAYAAFYQRLGFSVSDCIDMRMGPGVLPITFMHCNPRHHTLAFAPAPFAKRCIHLMLQTMALDDVGFAVDRAKRLGVPITMSLGRHSNDEMVSVYFETPSGFEFEYGWGARVIDPDWTVVRHDTTSKWGHEMLAAHND